MTDLWQLPTALRLGDRSYPIHADYRDILEIMDYLEDPSRPELLRWQIALALFYREPVPEALRQPAMEALADFIRCGAEESKGEKLLDWQQDAMLIISDMNKAAGQELRSLPFLHWWSFLGWFHAIGRGQLSTVVGIRDKLRRGQPLQPEEQQFYRQHPDTVRLRQRLSPHEQAEKDRLNALIGEK